MSSQTLTEESKLKIIKHFLLSSPPGEFEDILSDIRDIIDDDELLNRGALDFFYAYNVEQLIPVNVEVDQGENAGDEEKRVVLCSYAQVDENDHSSFYNPLDNTILKVDHTKGKVVQVEESTVPFTEKQLSLTKHLQDEISKYVAKTYNSGLVTVYPQRETGNPDSNKFVCAITASKFNEKNFWSGRWRGVYSIDLKDDSTAELSGSMKVNVHYYEDGNVQLNTSRDHLSTCKGSDIAAEIVKAMDSCETAFQGHIDETCMNMSDVFKRLRRKLPFTGKLFDFETGAQKMVIS